MSDEAEVLIGTERAVAVQDVVGEPDPDWERVEPGSADEVADGTPPPQMSPGEMAKFAQMMIDQIDDNPAVLPNLPLNTGNLEVWALESCFLPPATPEDQPEPGLIITFASATDPRGTPHVLSRDRALKFASQIRKQANTGPSIQQRAAQAGLDVPPDAPSSGGLILPPGVAAPLASDEEDE